MGLRKQIRKRASPSVTQPNKQVAKWTRINRMEVGLNEVNNPASIPKTLQGWF